MAEDIQIGADTSQAVSALGKILASMEGIARQSGATGKSLNGMLTGLERGAASITSSMAKAASSQAAVTQGLSAEARAAGAATKSVEDLARARARATAATGLKQNSAGQAIDAKTGQFVSSERAASYQRQLELNTRAEQSLGDLRERLHRVHMGQEGQRARSAARIAAQARTQTKAYQEQQQMLNRVFQATDRNGLAKLSNTLGKFPPATWSRGIAEIQTRIAGMSNSMRYALYDVSTSFGVAGAAILGFGVLSVNAAIAHERAFANVRRTTQTSAEGYEHLRVQLQGLAMELPVTYEEITQIASAAGQLGISAGGVTSFTSTVAKLSATTNLTSDAAGIALARFRAFFAEVGADKGLNVTEQTFSNLASSILKVGVNSIATETGIVNVATQIASMGQYAGYTANQTIGLAGALSSIGVAPELSRGTITRTFSLIGNAVSKGGDELQEFASLAGMSADQFKASWGTENFAGTFTAMMQGLYNVTQSGEDANLMLMDLGFNSVRDRPLLLRLAGAANEAGEAGGLLAQTMADALEGWSRNSELALQYSKISQTTSARVQVLGQAFEQLFASMGERTGGFVGQLAADMTNLVKGFESFSRTDAGQILGTFAAQGALVVGSLALMVAGAARGAASLQGIGSAWAEVSKGTGAATTAVGRFKTAMNIANLSLGLIGLVATLGAVVGGWIAMNDAAQKAKRGVQDVGGLVAAMSEDAKNGSDGVRTYAQVTGESIEKQRNSAEQARQMSVALGEVGVEASKSASNMGDLASASSSASYIFGDSAKAFYKSQLVASESFQNLFDPKRVFGGLAGDTLSGAGISTDFVDWNQLMLDSVSSSGIDRDKLIESLMEQSGITDKGSKRGEMGNIEFNTLTAFADEAIASYQNLDAEIQKEIQAQAALNTVAKQTFTEMVDGGSSAADMMSQLSEDAMKVAESMATGFQNFADPSSLIGLTQKMVSTEKGAAEAYEKAWTDAFGGASFKLGDYLTNFRKASTEQQGFITNLQRLGERGLGDDIIADLAAMGPEANRLVQALVDGTKDQLDEFENLWGQTGYDSMIQFAVQQQMAQNLVRNVIAHGMTETGEDALAAFNAALASGVGVEQALADLQLDINGHPLKPAVEKPEIPNLTWAQRKVWEEQNRLVTDGYVRLHTAILDGAGIKTGTKVITPYAGGGYTGDGGKYQEAGIVHKGEFVMTKEATSAIGVSNLYAMMRSAQGSRSMPRGRGYATGGFVSGGSSGPTVVYLSPQDRELLRSIQPIVRIGDRDIARAQGSANFRQKREGVG